MFLIVVVGLLTYSNTFHVPFQFDDFPNLADNQLLKNLDNFIADSKGYNYNPGRFIGYLSFAVNYHFGGLNVMGYHIVNLAIHIANALLVYLMVVLTFSTPFMRRDENIEGGKVRRCEGATEPKVRRCEDAKMSKIPTSILLTTSQVLNFSTSGNPEGIAFFSALLFVAHPVQTQAVTYIVQRFTSLAAMFYLLSVVAYIKARLMGRAQKNEDVKMRSCEGEKKTKGQRCEKITTSQLHNFTTSALLFYLLSFISAVLAMKTKEITFTLPVIIILYEFTFFKTTLKNKLIFIVPMLLTMMIIPLSIYGTGIPLGEIISDVSKELRVQTSLSRWDYLMTQMRVITTYIRLIFLPVNQNLDYNYPVFHSLFQLPVFLSFVFLAAILCTGVYLIIIGKRQKIEVEKVGSCEVERQPVEKFSPSQVLNLSPSRGAPELRLVGFGILWFFITLSVESSIIPIADVIYEHRLYLPSAGAFIAITTAAFIAADRKGMGRAVVITLLLIIVALAGASYSRNAVWQDRVRLWEDVVRKSPRNIRAHNNLVAELIKKHKFDEAINEIRMAIVLKPDNAEAYYDLGLICQATYRINEAVENYLTSAKLKPDFAWTHLNLGIIYYKDLNKPDKAEEEFLTAARLIPDLAEAHFNLGLIYQNRDMPDKAIEQYLIDIRLRPDHVASYDNLGFIYYKTGQMEKARSELAIALKLQPNNITTQSLLKQINTKDR